MTKPRSFIYIVPCLSLLLVSWAAAETKIEVTGLHHCCGTCLKAINKAITSVGAQASINSDDNAVKITAPDQFTARKAVDNLAAAGFHGTIDGEGLSMKDDSDAPSGQVTKLTVSGAHNCCNGCSNALAEACKKVSGITSTTIMPKKASFTVEGNFDAQSLVRALNDAGFHVKVAAQ